MSTTVADRNLRVAVLGLGTIGSRMATRLANAGHPTSVWNRTPRELPELDHPQITVAASPAAAVIDARYVVLALTDDTAVRDVVTGPDGALSTMTSGVTVIDTSTIHPETAREIHAACAAQGVGYVDAPLTGGAEKAAAGTLTLLCGGDEEDVNRARTVMDHLASRAEHFGPSGAGQIAKAVNQVILAGALLGVAEGIAMAEECGLDAGHLAEVLADGAAASWVLSGRAGWMVERSFPPAGKMSLHLKDLKISLDMARRSGQVLPGAALVMGMQEVLTSVGHGDEDISALVRFYRP